MFSRVFRHVALPLIAAAIAVALVFLLRDRMPLTVQRLTNGELIFAAIALFVVLLSVANHATVQIFARNSSRRIASVGAFEAELRRKVMELESQVTGLTEAAEQSQAELARLMHAQLREENRRVAEATEEQLAPPPLDENIIQFDKTGRARPAGPATKEKEPEGALEIWFQPVVTLPGRKTRFFDSIPFLAPPAGTGEAKPAPAPVTNVANTCEVGLGESLRFARELERKERGGGVIWHVNTALLSDLAAHRRTRSAMEANSRISDRLVVAIGHKDFSRLNRATQERLFAFKEKGFRVAISDLPDAEAGRKCLKSGLFSLVIGSAEQMLSIGAAGTGPTTETIRFSEYSCEALAYGVTNENTAMALIDHDILLAQGDLFSPARPLRSKAKVQAGAGA
jgi:hypothetical protein